MFFNDSYQAMRRGERMLAARRFALSVAVFALIFPPVGFFMLRRIEKAITFHPERAAAGDVWRVPQGAEDVWFDGASGARLHGWFFRAGGSAARATVVYFHGNGGNVSYVGWMGEAYARRGYDALLFDYRGYGRSEGEVSDERALYEDADAAYRYVVATRGAQPESVVLHGQSLGTTAAADLAARQRCGAVVLESGLSSAREMAGVLLPWLPGFVRGLTRNKFDSASKLGQVRCPVLVIHGDRDEVIPVAQGRALYEAAPGPKRLLVVEGAGHNDLALVAGQKYINAVAEFLDGALATRAP